MLRIPCDGNAWRSGGNYYLGRLCSRKAYRFKRKHVDCGN